MQYFDLPPQIWANKLSHCIGVWVCVVDLATGRPQALLACWKGWVRILARRPSVVTEEWHGCHTPLYEHTTIGP